MGRGLRVFLTPITLVTVALLVWAALYGFLLFGTIPRAETFVGAAIIAASGLYIFFRERQRRQV